MRDEERDEMDDDSKREEGIESSVKVAEVVEPFIIEMI